VAAAAIELHDAVAALAAGRRVGGEQTVVQNQHSAGVEVNRAAIAAESGSAIGTAGAGVFAGHQGKISQCQSDPWIHSKNANRVPAAESGVGRFRVQDGVGGDGDCFGDDQGADRIATVKPDYATGAEREAEARKITGRNQYVESGWCLLKVNATQSSADGECSARR